MYWTLGIEFQDYFLTGLIFPLLIHHGDRADHPVQILNFLGNISYSLSLGHLPIGSRIVNFGGRFVSNVPSLWALDALATSISIAASYVFYILVERPSQKLSQKIKVRPKQIQQKT